MTSTNRSLLIVGISLFSLACGSLPREAVRTPDNSPLVTSIPYESDGDEPATGGRMDGVEFFIRKDLANPSRPTSVAFENSENTRQIQNIPELKSVFEADGREWRPSKGYNIPLVRNAKVEKWIRFFTGPIRGNYARWLTRASLYAPTMEKILREQGVPTDLIYLSMVESGFNPKATSHANAAGSWQFIRSTGKMYGLQSGGLVDERRDLIKSTRAAAKHLKDLHKIYGDWYLAWAAYNAGPGSVNRAIRRSGTRNFWKMTEGKTRYLRQETKDYVPRILAAAIVAKDYRRYGFSSSLFGKSLDYDVATVPDATDVDVIAKCAGTTVEDIAFLNPSLVAGVTPPGKTCAILVPGGTEERFQKNYSRIPREQRLGYSIHQVRRKETLASIANRYKVGRTTLAKANRLGTKSRLSTGSYVLIPKKKGSIDSYLDEPTTVVAAKPRQESVVDIIEASPLNPVSTAYAASDEAYAEPAPAPVPPAPEFIVHSVRRGESLWVLSKKYGVAIATIKKWNSLKGNRIQPRQKIRIYSKAAASTGKVALTL
ncbi:MAG: transglycosylase SLT domain-containing protein [Deltaproteobacteria bacterium]|nr:transglycosylase SLT domain-containing protein [Deltaproteobacteria bacterium]